MPNIEIRNLPVNPNPLALSDILPVDPSATTTTVSNTVHDIVCAGPGNTASGLNSRTEGALNTASGAQSHAEGNTTIASANNAHAEGTGTLASGNAAHAEGNGTQATANEAHAEGYSTTASGQASHAEGQFSIASGAGSHSEGYTTLSAGDWSNANGLYAQSNNYNEWSRGVAKYTGSLTSGLNQAGIVLYTISTTNATPAEAFLDQSATQRFVTFQNTAYNMRVYMVANSSAGQAVITQTLLVSNSSGTVTITNIAGPTSLAHTGTLGTATFAITASSTHIIMTVTGVAATTIFWTGRIDYEAATNQ